MKIIFEDNTDVACSKLLLTSVLGPHMIFTEGNGNLFEYIEVNSADELMVYVDVSLTNSVTVHKYATLATQCFRLLGVSWWEQVHLIPIPCIEWYILELINLYFDDKTISEFLTEYIFPSEIPIDFTNAVPSVEGLSKLLLNAVAKRLPSVTGSGQYPCLLNKKKSGKFYIQDCNCIGCDSKLRQLGSLVHKANSLYALLPIICQNKALLDSVPERNIQIVTWKYAQRRITEFYADQYNKLVKIYGREAVTNTLKVKLSGD